MIVTHLLVSYPEKNETPLMHHPLIIGSVVIKNEDRFIELQKVKMFIADRNVFGIDLNPVAVELAEVSLISLVYSIIFIPTNHTPGSSHYNQ